MAQTILYYPKIDIQDGRWLRNAILYWDEVSSIVPYENYADLSPELLYLQNLGIYNAVYPQDLFFSRFSEEFCDTIIKRIKHSDYSVARNPYSDRNEYVRVHKNKIYAPTLQELIHYKKIPSKILSFFEEKRFVNDLNVDGWMEIDSKVAQIYMRTLAEYSIKCSDKDIVLGTDTATHNREIYSNARNRIDPNTRCCKINIEKCLPQPSMDVSFEDILDFKDRRKDELLAFRSQIRELETNIYNADSPQLIKHYENQFIEGWERCSNDFYRVLKEARIRFLLGSLTSIVATPFVGQVLSQYLGANLSTAIQTGAAVINIGIGHFDYKDKISIEAKEEANNVYLTAKVDPADKGKVIGKDGCIIKAVRTILGAYAAKENKKVTLKLED